MIRRDEAVVDIEREGGGGKIVELALSLMLVDVIVYYN